MLTQHQNLAQRIGRLVFLTGRGENFYFRVCTFLFILIFIFCLSGQSAVAGDNQCPSGCTQIVPHPKINTNEKFCSYKIIDNHGNPDIPVGTKLCVLCTDPRNAKFSCPQKITISPPNGPQYDIELVSECVDCPSEIINDQKNMRVYDFVKANDRYVADFSQYLDSFNLSGTNYLPSLFNPIIPGFFYILFPLMIWLYIQRTAQRRVLLIIGLMFLALGIFLNSSFSSDCNICRSFIFIKDFPLKIVKQTQSSITTCQGNPLSGTGSGIGSASNTNNGPISIPKIGQETSNSSSNVQPYAVRSNDSLSSSIINNEPSTSSPNPPPHRVGMVQASDGGVGNVELSLRDGNYHLVFTDIPRAGEYNGKINDDSVGKPISVKLSISDWWPYVFITFVLGYMFTHYTLKKHGLLLTDTPPTDPVVIAVVALVAAILNYIQVGGAWGTPASYLKAFLLGAVIKIGAEGVKTLSEKIRRGFLSPNSRQRNSGGSGGVHSPDR